MNISKSLFTYLTHETIFARLFHIVSLNLHAMYILILCHGTTDRSFRSRTIFASQERVVMENFIFHYIHIY